MNIKKLFSAILLVLLSTSNALAQNRTIAITIDDLLATPADIHHYEYITDNLLKTLKENNIQAIGFVNESRLFTDGKPDSVKIKTLEKWLVAKMDLGNHTFSHVYINNTTLAAYKSDVLKGEEITRPLMKRYGKELLYFRHPQLRTGPTDDYRIELNTFLKEHGYKTAPVTIDNDEYMHAYCYAKAKAQNDTIIMQKIATDYIGYMEKIFAFYENLSSEFLGYELPQTLLIHANNLNADYLDELIGMMKRRGYTFVSIDDALKDKAYTLKDGTHSKGLSWIQRWMAVKGEEPDLHPAVSNFIQEMYQNY